MERFSEQTRYERLQNGADVYSYHISKSGMVIVNVALPGGSIGMREVLGMRALFGDLFPNATKTKTKAEVKEQFDALGARVSIAVEKEFVCFQLITLPRVFPEALELLFTVVSDVKVSAAEWEASVLRVTNAVGHSAEDTSYQANIALLRMLFDKNHPHYSPTTVQVYKKLPTVEKSAFLSERKKMCIGTGAVITVVGDVSHTIAQNTVARVTSVLRGGTSRDVPHVSANAFLETSEVHVEVQIDDKENVNTLAGIPLTLSLSSSAFLPLSIAVRVLGGDVSGRLFNTLRTKESLTYGAYASLASFTRSYPGYLRASSIFPTTLYKKGREKMCALVETFCEKGITARELEQQKTKMRYSYILGLATTSGLSRALTDSLLQGQSLEYLDTLVERVDGLTLREVNASVKEHVDVSRMKTAVAGSVADVDKII